MSDVEGFNSAEVLEQIRVFKLVDGVNIVLGASSTKLSRLETLADLLSKHFGKEACDRPQAWLEQQAGRAPRRKSTRATSERDVLRDDGRAWPLDDDTPIVGARIAADGRREYLNGQGNQIPKVLGRRQVWMRDDSMQE